MTSGVGVGALGTTIGSTIHHMLLIKDGRNFKKASVIRRPIKRYFWAVRTLVMAYRYKHRKCVKLFLKNVRYNL